MSAVLIKAFLNYLKLTPMRAGGYPVIAAARRNRDDSVGWVEDLNQAPVHLSATVGMQQRPDGLLGIRGI